VCSFQVKWWTLQHLRIRMWMRTHWNLHKFSQKGKYGWKWKTQTVTFNRTSSQEFNTRLETVDYNKEFIGKFRNQCKNAQLRHIYFRLISKDFLTMEKLFKCQMVNNNKFGRCGEVQLYSHLLWECREASKI
jgi:hypothetical protein